MSKINKILPLFFVPVAMPAFGNELAQCRNIFRDNMEVMVFTIPCDSEEQDKDIPPQKLSKHLQQVRHCEALLMGKYAAQSEQEQERLNKFVLERSAQVRKLSGKPQQMQDYCRKQNDTARQILMRY